LVTTSSVGAYLIENLEKVQKSNTISISHLKYEKHLRVAYYGRHDV